MGGGRGHGAAREVLAQLLLVRYDPFQHHAPVRALPPRARARLSSLNLRGASIDSPEKCRPAKRGLPRASQARGGAAGLP